MITLNKELLSGKCLCLVSLLWVPTTLIHAPPVDIQWISWPLYHHGMTPHPPHSLQRGEIYFLLLWYSAHPVNTLCWISCVPDFLEPCWRKYIICSSLYSFHPLCLANSKHQTNGYWINSSEITFRKQEGQNIVSFLHLHSYFWIDHTKNCKQCPMRGWLCEQSNIKCKLLNKLGH